MNKKRGSLEDVYYWLSILLVVTGVGYFVAQGTESDTDTNALSVPSLDSQSRLEALRSVIDNDEDKSEPVVMEEDEKSQAPGEGVENVL